MNKYIAFGFFWCFCFFTTLQAQPVFNLSNETALDGETVEVDFTVDNFEKIVSMQFSVNWDSTVLAFKEVINVSAEVTGLSPALFSFPSLVGKGKLGLVWFEQNNIPITLANGTRVFTVVYDVMGQPCDETSVAFTDDPADIEVAVEGDIPVTIVANDGSVMIPGQDCMNNDFELIGSTESGNNGDNVCVSFVANGFQNLGVAQFTLQFDQNVLDYTAVQNFGLPGLSTGNFNDANAENGELVFIWFDNSAMGVDLADGTTIFDVCFDIVGSNGQSSLINYTNLPDGGNVEIADIDGNIWDVDLTPGRVNVTGGNVEGLALFFGDTCGSPNSTVCIDLTVQDFEDILTLEGVITWDSTVLQYDRVENFGLPDFSEANIGPPGSAANDASQATMVWFDNAVTGLTLPDETVILSICFQLIGDEGESSTINFSSIEMADNNVVILNPTLIGGTIDIDSDCSPCGFSIDDVNNPCSGEMNGTIDISVFGCIQPVTFQWEGPTGFTSTNEDLSGLAPGSYMLTITTGDNNLLIPGAIVLDDVADISSTAVITQPTAGMNDGAIDLMVTGGTAPYTFVWSPGGTNDEDLVEVGEGQYTVIITDDAGCTFEGGPYILGSGLAANVTDVACFEGTTGSIDLTVGFGTGPYTFIWNDTNNSTTEDIANLTAGEYCVTVTDVMGATMDMCFDVLQPSTAITVTATITNDDDDNNMGNIVISVQGGLGPYSFVWDNGETTQNIIGLGAGQYCVTITDNLGCTFMECYDVFGSELQVSLTNTDFNGFGVSCPGVCDGEIIANVGNVFGNAVYNWSDDATINDQMRTDLCAGIYMVTVTDDSGVSATAQIELTEADIIEIDETIMLPSSQGNTDGSIVLDVSGGTPPYTYLWNDPAQSTSKDLDNLENGEYMVIVTDANNCEAMKVIPLRGGAECFEGISVITPNDDDKNENLIISCVNTQNNEISIFNRWGSLVYEQNNYDNTWNGTDQDNDPVADGGYHWVLEVFLSNGDRRIYRGTVSVFRSAN